MDLSEWMIPAARLSRFEQAWDRPLALLVLEASQDANDIVLPPCPVIGIGASGDPLAGHVDLLVDSPIACEPLARNILAHPRAAATLVEVLRTTQGLGPAHALTVESLAYAMLQGSAEHRAWLAARAPQPVQPAGNVHVERHAAGLAVTLDRPWAGNAIDQPMRDGLAAALSLACLDPDLLRVTVQARGRAFSLGADLAEFGTTGDPATAHAIRALTLPARAAIACAERLHVHIDGACLGAGLELAAFGARVTASSRAWFQLPELAMGIIPGAGGCVSLPRRIGRQRTALMVLSGRRVGARQALAWGLVDALVDDATAHDGGDDVA